MRVTRIITGIVALALFGFLPSVSSSAAASIADSASSARVTTQAQKLTVYTHIVKRRGKLIMRGYVRPPQGPVTIQKATRCDKSTGMCNFKVYRRVGLHHGKYHTRVYAPNRGAWYWRAKVGHFHSRIWKTFKE